MSGVNLPGTQIRKGAADAVKEYVKAQNCTYSKDCEEAVKKIANSGGTPLVVAKNGKIMEVIHLKDIITSGVKEKFADLRKMGIKTIMITGDNPMTAAAIAAEAGVDDFLAQEAGNMVDLDSSPTKLIDIVRIGKQLLMTRGSLTTFSIANDVAKYFAIIPAMFMTLYPGLAAPFVFVKLIDVLLALFGVS